MWTLANFEFKMLNLFQESLTYALVFRKFWLQYGKSNKFDVIGGSGEVGEGRSHFNRFYINYVILDYANFRISGRGCFRIFRGVGVERVCIHHYLNSNGK